ncbi:MAG: hypothetical protein PHX61_00285 [Alphaproteobacteria bacterium]|nr:hypothetical protein [Alphaproteobacteria bacterium]
MIFRISKSLILSTSLLALAACTPQGPNQWMPKGYTHQDSTPISSPAPSSPWLDEAVIKDTESLASNTASWQGAVFELIDGLQPVLPVDGSPINVRIVPPVINQDLALDHYVRQAMIQKNLTLTTTDGLGLNLLIDSQPLTSPDALAQARTTPNFDYVEDMKLNGIYLLTAKLTDASGSVLGESKTVGVFPHEKAEYFRLPGSSIAPVTGLTNKPTPIYMRD